MRHFISSILLFKILLSGTFFSNNVAAQFTNASININGLTCSQCTKSVEMQLKKISTIQTIQMDLKNTTATIQFKKNYTVDLLAIAKAVTNAGFSVGTFVVTLPASSLNKIDTYCYKIGRQHFQSNNKPNNTAEFYKLQLIGKQFGNIKPNKNIPSCAQSNLLYFSFL